MSEPTTPLKPPLAEWAGSLGREALDLWKESLANLRQLHNDVWNGVKFFTTINGILLAAVGVVVKASDKLLPTLVLASIICFLGILITLLARRILQRHRDYYLNMLLRKSLIEQELGFYDRIVGKTDLSFPWSVPKQYLPRLRDDPAGWLEQRRRASGTITRLLFWAYEGTLIVWFAMVVACFVAIGYALCGRG